MSLRQRLLAYLIGLHLVFFAFSVALFAETPWLFMAVESMLLVSLGGGVHLINRALEPLGYTRQLQELLQDQDYAARLHNTHGAELGELVAQFNEMLGTLYQKRLEIGEQQGFLDRLLEATPSAVVVFDFDGRVSLLNASAQALLALGDAKGKPLSNWPSDSLAGQLDTLPLGQSRMLRHVDGRRFRGQRGHFFDRGFARHFLLIDELTEELESSEKATYEKLIRVLAHEVNNTVAATGSVLDSLLFYSAQLNEGDRADFGTAIVAVKRRNTSLGEFIERFTRVVKMPTPELRPVALAPMVDDILWLYREQCRSRGIEIGWDGCEEVPARAMDAQLMEQALLNIVKNAMEAVEESGVAGGRIRLSLAREEMGVRLSVSDSGNLLGGVPAGQLFTPFFSTKKGGQGIGLMFVREVLTRHG
ncbi:MAG: ATP-binding protein, partial [Massilia sp.]